MEKSIILIGMPGAGKSTVGVLLAKAVGLPFIDTDLLIQAEEKGLLQEIINAKGLENFLKIEERVVLKRSLKKCVVATGGSVVYSSRAMGKLKDNGLVVYLKLDFEEIQKRIKNITTRGIAMGEGKSLRDIYDERVPLYEKYSDIIVNCSGKSVEKVVKTIMEEISAVLQSGIPCVTLKGAIPKT